MDEIALLRIMPHAGVNTLLYPPHRLNVMTEFDSNTPARQSAFLGQITHESGELKCVEENLNYSAARPNCWRSAGGRAGRKVMPCGAIAFSGPSC